MECAKAKDLFSEYIDGTLDAQTKANINEHLLTCPLCKDELLSMKELVKELRSLESLKASDDFLEKLHERLEPRFSFRKILRILFVPGRIKIPLEFATATAMAILIFSIIYIQQPEEMIPEVPLSSRHAKITEKTSADIASPTVKEEAYVSKPVVEKATAQPPAKKREIIEFALLIEKEGSGKVYGPSEAVDKEQAQRSETERPRMARPAAPKAEMKTDTLKKEKQIAGLAIQERSVLEEEPLSSFSRLHETLTKVKEQIRLVDGKILIVEYEPHTDRPQSILAEIPARNYTSFCYKLNRLAILQNAPPTISEKGQSTLQILIRFLSS
ncbi:MAG: zf-HC2 domain-containing protein [Desulfobacteraceae bacterium]|nr:MAG: zf-HC2 domain-containing protein [Desulfobacteraceae bacterium]